MFGNNDNTTSDLMLPILLDMANLIRRAVRSGKEPRDVKQPLTLPQAQLLRRSFTEDTYLDDEPFDIGVSKPETTTKTPPRIRRIRPQRTTYTRTRNYTNTLTDNGVKDDRVDNNITASNITQNNLENITNDTPDNTIEDEVSTLHTNSTRSIGILEQDIFKAEYILLHRI